mmetsp:Transcript_13500/g.17162  ORF Transcript_13500/g.17162 Transcript_13500/m.17162 type:complete len:107 (+) Transcript_13500:113-433(+)
MYNAKRDDAAMIKIIKCFTPINFHIFLFFSSEFQRCHTRHCCCRRLQRQEKRCLHERWDSSLAQLRLHLNTLPNRSVHISLRTGGGLDNKAGHGGADDDASASLMI